MAVRHHLLHRTATTTTWSVCLEPRKTFASSERSSYSRHYNIALVFTLPHSRPAASLTLQATHVLPTMSAPDNVGPHSPASADSSVSSLFPLNRAVMLLIPSYSLPATAEQFVGHSEPDVNGLPLNAELCILARQAYNQYETRGDLEALEFANRSYRLAMEVTDIRKTLPRTSDAYTHMVANGSQTQTQTRDLICRHAFCANRTSLS
ncbi:hypothetical protein BDY19DRAFT_656892 [Irpex rosettiformis]|uniref:Uncharacterized protein n=1 Tax=Irpex rosettiformis TaxID=378272 RepID=A0ACB8TNF7_9APHY|nr:hypothetical protein BDY19DRAFT_656892 [Irpex rosettiformis]